MPFAMRVVLWRRSMPTVIGKKKGHTQGKGCRQRYEHATRGQDKRKREQAEGRPKGDGHVIRAGYIAVQGLIEYQCEVYPFPNRFLITPYPVGTVCTNRMRRHQCTNRMRCNQESIMERINFTSYPINSCTVMFYLRDPAGDLCSEHACNNH